MKDPGAEAGKIDSKNNPQQSPFFSVVVVTFRRPRELGQVLEALERQEDCPPFEVLVIDNDPKKSGQGVAAPFMGRHPGWRYAASPSNNVSLARNTGAGLARGAWLAFLDDDCVPQAQWLAKAKTTILTFPEPGLIFGGPCETSWEKITKTHGRFEKFLPNQYLLEGNLFFHRAEYLALGGMRKDLGPRGGRFGYHEGSELQDRHHVKFGATHRRLLVPCLAVYHLKSNPMKDWQISLLAGFDAAGAFSKEKIKPLHWIYLFFKLAGPVVRMLPCLFPAFFRGTKERVRKEMYRLGENLGEISLGLNQSTRKLSGFLRKANNRLVLVKKVAQPAPVLDRVKIPEASRPGGWMAGKVGTTELLALEFSDRWFQPVWPETASWKRAMRRLFVDSGVFPETRKQLEEFLDVYRKAVRELDVVCAWQEDKFLQDYEEAFLGALCPAARRVGLDWLSTEILGAVAGWSWLVVSPFTETMKQQSPHLPKVHAARSWAPRLAGQEKRCEFVRCPTFSYLEKSPFASWTEGLENLAEKMLAKDFEVALIGAGAWSLPLAARMKRAGRKAIHLGGETQLLFGIKGQRWEGYGIYNEHWVRPSTKETPAGFLQKEQGCYW